MERETAVGIRWCGESGGWRWLVVVVNGARWWQMVMIWVWSGVTA